MLYPSSWRLTDTNLQRKSIYFSALKTRDKGRWGNVSQCFSLQILLFFSETISKEGNIICFSTWKNRHFTWMALLTKQTLSLAKSSKCSLSCQGTDQNHPDWQQCFHGQSLMQRCFPACSVQQLCPGSISALPSAGCSDRTLPDPAGTELLPRHRLPASKAWERMHERRRKDGNGGLQKRNMSGQNWRFPKKAQLVGPSHVNPQLLSQKRHSPRKSPSHATAEACFSWASLLKALHRAPRTTFTMIHVGMVSNSMRSSLTHLASGVKAGRFPLSLSSATGSSPTHSSLAKL